MDGKRVYECIREILKTDLGDYPEIQNICIRSIGPEGELYAEPGEIADKIYNADAKKQLPPSVANFLIEYYTDEIEAGDYDAACDLGSLCYSGRIGRKDYKQAVEYYTLAADNGCRQAQENLGYCYYYGRDVAVDYEKAFHYFALGAFDGHLRSLYKIGDMYRNGYYVKKDPREAFYIYNRCVETMTDEAIPEVGADVFMRMGDCFSQAIGVDADLQIALMFYQRAEQLFYKRLKEGDYMIKGCYDHSVKAQEEIRKKLQGELPGYDWV